MTDPDEMPSRYLFVRVDDLDGAISLEAERLGLSPGVYVRRALARSNWLRDVQGRGGRVLVEDEKTGLLHQVRWPGSLR